MALHGQDGNFQAFFENNFATCGFPLNRYRSTGGFYCVF